MYNTTDVHTLGTDYTVLDKKGKPIGNIQVITQTEILEAAIGYYSPEVFESFEEYLSRSVEVLSGFEDIDPLKVMWFASEKEDVTLSEIVERAMKYGYNIIILEHLEEIDE